MSDRATLVYYCDGSLPGILCCVFESYVQKELPVDILPMDQPTFYPVKRIVTNEGNARRVWRSLEKMGGEVCAWIQDGYLSCTKQKEKTLFDFIRLAFTHRANVTSMFAHPVVSEVWNGVRFIKNEAHFFVEFLRFSEHEGILASVIEPKAFVLPRLERHFRERFPEERFVIYDKTHRMAVFYRPYESVLQPVDDIFLSEVETDGKNFQELWKHYYQTAGIKERYNPKCRMNHMPKRYWSHMLEVEGELDRLKTVENSLPKQISGEILMRDLLFLKQ